MTFQYKVPRSLKYMPGKHLPKVSPKQEVLTGQVLGKKAYADEERAYRGAMKTGRVLVYYPQFILGVEGMPGYRTLDALVNTLFGWRAFEYDGSTFVHRSEAKKAEDKLADYQRLEHLRDMGVRPRNGVEHISDAWLQNQDDADRKMQEIL